MKEKKLSEVAREWDFVCGKRAEVIQKGEDFSLLGVNIPCVLKYLELCNKTRVLDVGCGTGYLTHILSQKCELATGIDISPSSIDIARKSYSGSNLVFQCSSILDYLTDIHFDTCVANMVLMTDPNVKESVAAVYRLLQPGGHFLFTITHPYFWPKYWGYDKESWFDYKKEIFIENDFSTSLSDSMGTTTHIHRPLSMYMEFLAECGFLIKHLDEPYPALKMPEGYTYSYPRFLFVMCQKPQ